MKKNPTDLHSGQRWGFSSLPLQRISQGLDERGSVHYVYDGVKAFL